MAYQCGFDINNYADVLPDIEEYLKHDYILNFEDYEKGNIENCYWKKHIVTYDEIQSEEFRKLEAKRIIKTGVWIYNKDELLWLPPNYYSFLQYGTATGDIEFRLKRLDSIYKHIRARNNPRFIGTLTIKNRGDGETTEAMFEALHAAKNDGKIVGNANIGIQSKTGNDAKNICWLYVKNHWNGFPRWYKDLLYSDIRSESNIEEKISFESVAVEPHLENGIEVPGRPGRTVNMRYFPCTHNAMDGNHNMIQCILDEGCKWTVSIALAITNYKKFISLGPTRQGMFNIFSSPADFECKSNEEMAALWDSSDPDDVDPVTGVTKSGFYRIHSNPLMGIPNTYDQYGDVDPNYVYDLIMETRKNAPEGTEMAEVRACPLNRQEMFESMDADTDIWTNSEGVKKRKIFIINASWKDNVTKEPKVICGKFDWENGRPHTDVRFIPSGNTDIKDPNSRFRLTNIPRNRPPLIYGDAYDYKGNYKGIRPLPPDTSTGCLGVDPYEKRYDVGLKLSKGSMVYQNLDPDPDMEVPGLVYVFRPEVAETMWKDIILAAVYLRCLIQIENKNTKPIDYLEDEGYFDWMLPKIGEPEDSPIKGDAPGGRNNKILEMGMSLADGFLSNEKRLAQVWDEILLNSASTVDPKKTTKADAFMAWIEAMIGNEKIRERETANDPDSMAIAVDLMMDM